MSYKLRYAYINYRCERALITTSLHIHICRCFGTLILYYHVNYDCLLHRDALIFPTCCKHISNAINIESSHCAWNWRAYVFSSLGDRSAQ